MLETAAHFSTLSEQLHDRIARSGPIAFRDWMSSALYDPNYGYYCRDEARWGREGDYRTSPERSRLFAATLARYFAKLYEELGRPAQWTVAEVGAGEGEFARGLLHTLENYFPEVFSATQYVIVEISSSSRAQARERLERFGERVEFRQPNEISIDQGIVFSNELLDAFPVHRVTMQHGELQELYVKTGADGGFEWLPGELSTPRLAKYFAEQGIEFREGQIAEVNLDVEDWLNNVSAAMRDGYLITVDYGAEAPELYSSSADSPRKEGTLRGFRRHQFVEDVLARPGEQDLTTTVDWSFIKRTGQKLGFEVVEFERQDRFLLSAGLLEQLEVERQQCEDNAERAQLSASAREMILPDGMAAHFHVLVQRKSS